MALDGQVGREDQDAVRGGIEQRIQPLAAAHRLGVQLRILHGNGCLIGETAQQGAVVCREIVCVGAENENYPDHAFPRGKRQNHPVQQAHARHPCQLAQAAVDFQQFELVWWGIFGDLVEQGGKVAQKRSRQVVRDRHSPLAALAAQGDQPGLPGEHFDRDDQNASEQFFKIEFLGQGARNFQQVIALPNAEVGQQHGQSAFSAGL